MVFVKEQSPTKQWCQLANDVNFYLSDPPNSDLPASFERIDRVWSESEKKELTELYSGKKRKGVANSGIKYLLSSFEADKGENGLLILCRILDAIMEVIGSEGDRKKEKSIVKADAIAVLCRTTRKRLLARIDAPRNQVDTAIDQFLFKLLYVIGSKDNRFNLKIRMSGLIPSMCRLFIKQDTLPDSFYTLFIKSSRSPRNGQLIGRQEGFMNRLQAKVSTLNSSDSLENVLLLDKHLHIMFFTLKNRRTRIQMIRDSFVGSIVDILKKHLHLHSSKPTRLLSSFFGTSDGSLTAAHAEVTIGCLAILRLLAGNKKAKDEMVALGALDVCAKELKELDDDEAKSGQKAKIVESLCALCLRCMPPIPYPLENVRFPLEFALPQAPPTPSGRVRNSSSTNVSFDNGRSSDEDGMEDEDEGFNYQNASSNFEHSDEDDKDEQSQSMPLPKTLKLTATQLNKYTPFFVENEQGTMSQMDSTREIMEEGSWREFCEKTKHAMPIRELLPKEMFAGETGRKEKLFKNTNSMRRVILEELEKSSSRQNLSANFKVVYDLDSIAFDEQKVEDVTMPSTCGKLDNSKDLVFESRFESGNLRRATQVAPTHYELVLTPDLNQIRDHYQWFFFQVSNMRKGVPYTFEIVNCLKATSMYSQGMQPVMFSMMDQSSGWKRTGERVCYYRNLYSSDNGQIDEKSGEKKNKYYYSTRFDVTFPNTADVCYLAYHFPYTFSILNANIHFLRRQQLSAVYCREDVIGHSLAGNPIKMLTITSPGLAREVAAKKVIVISARVHPGESNASWMMQGVLESLICGSTPEMYRLRENFVFKIIPMLNPDGVINGSHRCSLAGVDLNRVWDRPSEVLHPEIYSSKAIIQYLCEVLNKKPFAFVDLHGHSKKYDCFVFGNNAIESWRREEVVDGQDEEEYLVLPKALEKTCAGKFNISECRFSISRTKESSARVNVWRQFGVSAAYTLESTYCGFQLAPNRGYQINIDDLKQIGNDLLLSFLEMPDKN